MRIVLGILFGTFLTCGTQAQDRSNGDKELTWDDVGIQIADAQNICNREASDNVFVQIDAKLWREEFRANCWFPVFNDGAQYYIRTYDWGSAPEGVLFGPDGATSLPIDIWAQGMHQNDTSVPFRRSLTLYRVACAAGTNRYAALQFVAYDAAGDVVQEWTRSEEKLKAAIPASKEEAITAAVCRR